MEKNEYTEEGISLQELFNIIIKKFYIVILFVIISMIIAFFYLKYATYEYQTSITILIDPIKKSSTIGKILSSDFFDSNNDISTEIQLLTNISNLNKAANKLDLTQYKDSKGLDYSNPSAIGSLKSKVSINTFKDTNIVELSVKDQNPKFAADYANQIAQSFNEMLSEYGQDSKNSQIEFLKEQIPYTEKQLDLANDKLFDYKAKTGIDFLSNSTASLVNHISYLQMRRKPLELQIIKSKSMINEIQKTYDMSLPTIEYYKEDNRIKEILKSYELAFDELILFDVVSNNNFRNTTNLSEVNYNINLSVNDRVTTLNSQMSVSKKDLFNRILELTKAKGFLITNAQLNPYFNSIIEQLCSEVDFKNITKNIKSFEDEFNKLPVIEKEITKLKSDVDSLEAIRKELNSLLEQITLTMAAENNNVKLITPASIPITPISPNRLLILAVSLLLGGAFGVLLCLILNMLDNNIYTFEDIKEVANPQKIPILGWIPLLKNKDNIEIGSPMFLEKVKNSSLEEQYKKIASNILYGKNKNNKIFTVTSCEINEGKSSLTCNIGTYLAKLGYKVLIIDGDLKQPSIERYFNLHPHKRGYITTLEENKDLKYSLVKPIKDLNNLHLASPGKKHIISSIFYSNTDFDNIIQNLRTHYDYVFLDTPPLEYAAELIGAISYVDSIIICTRVNICTKKNLSNLLEQLNNYTNKIGGIVATACTEKNIHPYSKYYTKSYYHYYYSHNSDIEFVKNQNIAKKIYKSELRKRKSIK